MAITHRLKRLFRADVHAVLDLLEEPQAVLKQAIREMQEQLDRKRGELARTRQAIDQLEAASGRLDSELEAARADLDLSLREGTEELTRKLIARKLSLEKQKRRGAERRGELEKLRDEAGRRLSTQQAQLESVLEKARIFAPLEEEDSPFAAAEAVLSRAEAGHAGAAVTPEEVELEWLRLRGRPGGEEAS